MRRTKFSRVPPPSQAEHERDEGPPASVASGLFNATRRRVLGFLFGQTDRAFHMQELFASTGTGNGAVQRELRKMEAAGLVTCSSSRGRKYFQANPHCPIHDELAALVSNSFGMAEPIRESFSGLEYCVELLFAYVPPDTWSSACPSMDLVLVLRPGLPAPDGRDVLDAHYAAEQRLVRGFTLTRIVPREALAQPDPFLIAALKQPRIWVFGHEKGLAGMTSGP